MSDKKMGEIIQTVRNMTDPEASILEAFISGLRVGKQISGKENVHRQALSQVAQAK